MQVRYQLRHSPELFVTEIELYRNLLNKFLLSPIGHHLKQVWVGIQRCIQLIATAILVH